MCRTKLHGLLTQLPKCEHHLHIEGTLHPRTLFALAKRNKIKLPSADEDASFASEEALLQRYRHFSSLDDFLHYYYIGMNVLLSVQDFEDLAWAYFQKARQDGVVHAEIFFDPQAHTERGVEYSTVVAGLKRGCEKAEHELGMSTQMICCFLRHLPAQSAMKLFQSSDFQKSVESGTIAGIGLDSSEIGFPPEGFEALYAEADARGLHLTAHAGEEGPAENIETSLRLLKCARIDHGIKLVEDEELMKRVAAQGVMLTVCPLSNVALRCVKSVADVPIRKFLDAGVQFSINSDDPTYLGGFILDNYCAVQEAHDLSIDDWKTICTNAINGSFCSQQRREDMLSMLQNSLAV